MLLVVLAVANGLLGAVLFSSSRLRGVAHKRNRSMALLFRALAVAGSQVDSHEATRANSYRSGLELASEGGTKSDAAVPNAVMVRG